MPSRPCLHCAGNGYVHLYEGWQHVGEEPCAACRGTGYLIGRERPMPRYDWPEGSKGDIEAAKLAAEKREAPPKRQGLRHIIERLAKANGYADNVRGRLTGISQGLHGVGADQTGIATPSEPPEGSLAVLDELVRRLEVSLNLMDVAAQEIARGLE